MLKQGPPLPFPTRKISETFLAFAEPVLRTLPVGEPERQLNTALYLAFTVWNAVVFADATDEHRYLADLREGAARDPDVAQLVEDLVSRKRAFFSHDHRLIGDWHVSKTRDGLNVKAEARDPHSVPRAPVH